jgi:hypothetical protein
VFSVSTKTGHDHFDKQTLMWAKPRLRTPAQFELWSHIVAIVHNHLVLARGLGAAEFQPWENKQRELTPQQVLVNALKSWQLLPERASICPEE